MLKKRGRKCGKGDVKKQNKKRRIKVQNTQLKGDFSHENRKIMQFIVQYLQENHQTWQQALL